MHYTLSLSLPAGLLGPPEGVLLRPPPPPPATPLTLPRDAGALGFLAPPPEGRDTALRCSSDRRDRTPLRGRLKTNVNYSLGYMFQAQLGASHMSLA